MRFFKSVLLGSRLFGHPVTGGAMPPYRMESRLKTALLLGLMLLMFGCIKKREEPNFKAQDKGRIVKLLWYKNKEADILYYTPYVKRPHETEWFPMPVVFHPDTEFVFKNLFLQFPNSIIQLTVTASDTANNESDFGNIVTISTDTLVTVVKDTIPPEAPNVKAADIITTTRVLFQ